MNNWPILPIWCMVIVIVISLALLAGLSFFSVKLFNHFNLNKRLNTKMNDFNFKDGWFMDSLKTVVFIFPLLLIVPLVIMNILFGVASF